MAKPNYKHQKRQKELARKTRQDEKLLKRTVRPDAVDEAGKTESVPETGATPGPVTT
jgi:hypothetical protein